MSNQDYKKKLLRSIERRARIGYQNDAENISPVKQDHIRYSAKKQVVSLGGRKDSIDN